MTKTMVCAEGKTYTCQDAVQPVEDMTLDNHCRLYGIVSSCRQAASSQDVVAVRGVSSWRPGTLKVHHPHTPPALAVIEARSSFGQAGSTASCLEPDPGLPYPP